MSEAAAIKPEEIDEKPPSRESVKGDVFQGFPAAPTAEEKAALAGGSSPPVGDGIKPRRGRPPRAIGEAKLKQGLMQNFTLIGVAVSAFNQYDGAVILAKSEDTANALVALANENPKVKRALESLMTASTWSQVGLAVGGMAIPIAANHGLCPPQFAKLFGVPMPPIEGASNRVE